MLKESGFTVITSDLLVGPEEDRHDLLTWQPERWDAIITNTPYANKTAFVKRALELQKPWLMLMPLEVLNSHERHRLFEGEVLQMWLENEYLRFESERATHPEGMVVSQTMVWVGQGWPQAKGARSEVAFLPLGRE